MEQTREQFLRGKIDDPGTSETDRAAFTAELDQLLQRAEAIEEKVQGEGIPFAVSGINFAGLPPEVITLIEQVVQADRRRLLNEHAVELEQIENDFAAYKEASILEIAAMNKELAELEADYDKCNQELRDERFEKLRLIGERDEANKGRDNAVAQLEEARKEIKRLESQIADYQQAKVFGEREAQKMIDVTPEESASIADSVEKVRNMFKADSWAEKADRGQDAFYKRNPELVPPELQVSQFRHEAEPADNRVSDSDTKANGDDVQPEVSQFQSEGEAILSGVEVPTVGESTSEDDQGAVSRSEFEALKADVEALKRINGIAA